MVSARVLAQCSVSLFDTFGGRPCQLRVGPLKRKEPHFKVLGAFWRGLRNTLRSSYQKHLEIRFLCRVERPQLPAAPQAGNVRPLSLYLDSKIYFLRSQSPKLRRRFLSCFFTSITEDWAVAIFRARIATRIHVVAVVAFMTFHLSVSCAGSS
jgi:hypothetical protein